MTPDQRIRELSAQLFRAENPAVIETVATLLKLAVDEYAQEAQREVPMMEPAFHAANDSTPLTRWTYFPRCLGGEYENRNKRTASLAYYPIQCQRTSGISAEGCSC